MMNNIKYLFVLQMLVLVCMPKIAQAVDEEAVFEIVNKFERPIWVTITAARVPNELGDKYEVVSGPIPPVKIESGGTKVWFKNSLGLNDTIKLLIDLDNRVRKDDFDHDFKYRFPAPRANGKTKFVTFNPKKSSDRAKWLYPQTGQWMGLRGITESGRSLKNNITDDNINNVQIYQGPMVPPKDTGGEGPKDIGGKS